ncbi:unnamed protein product [Rotaria sp. Silwood2]|nr:unnamed protein product [Rotaria sp. Silwood2]
MCKTFLPITHVSLVQELCNSLVPYTTGKFELLSDILKKKLNINIGTEQLQLISSLFGSNVLPNFSTGLNAKDLILEYSLLNKLPYFTPYQLTPFTHICPTCGKTLDYDLADEHLVTLYLQNHQIVPAVVYTLTCTHSRTEKNKYKSTLITPSFFQHNDERVFTFESFAYSKFLYFGGKNIFDRNILIQFMSDLVCAGVTFKGFLLSYNLQHMQKHGGDSKLNFLLFTRVVLSFALIHFMFFMGLPEVALPKNCQQEEMDNFFELIEPHVHQLMSNFWLQHKAVKSCGVHCSSALIGDGNYKIRRPICVLNSKKFIETPEFESMRVGCRNSPHYQHIYCKEHKEAKEEIENQLAEPFDSNESFYERPKQLKNGKKIYYDALSCKTTKDKPGAYIPTKFCTLDRFHYRNHRDPWCTTFLNPDRNENLAGINTAAAEQTFAWLNKFSKSFSRMSSKRFQLTLHLLFHYWNCCHIGLNAYHKDVARSFLPSASIEQQHIIKSSILIHRTPESIPADVPIVSIVENEFSRREQSNTDNQLNDDFFQINNKDTSEEQLEQSYKQDDEESSISASVFVSQRGIEMRDIELEVLYLSSLPAANDYDESTTFTGLKSLPNDASNYLSTAELSLWDKFQNITCINEFENQLESEDEQDDNYNSRRSTRIFNGLTFN